MAAPVNSKGVGEVNGDARVMIYALGTSTHAPASSIAALAPAVDGSRTLSEGFALPSVIAPASVPGGMGALLYVDQADGDLKVRFANGTVATIATN